MKNEIVEETKFKRWAEERWDAEVIKLGMVGRFGRVGRSDKLVLLPAKPFAIPVAFEFKREGKKPTKIQEYYRKRFNRMGIPTYVVTKASKAMAICEEILRTKKLPKGKHTIRH
jgi:hypothetical protein